MASSSSSSPPGSGRSDSSGRLLDRARGGDGSALDALFSRYAPWLRRWTRGRLPKWTRGFVDTSDLVQDVLLNTFTRLSRFEPRRKKALRAYLRLAVENRIRDEMRRAVRRPALDGLDDAAAPAATSVMNQETWARYLSALGRLKVRDRRLIVGRVEIGYSFKQLGDIHEIDSDAARKATERALERLAVEMGDPRQERGQP